MPEASQPRKRRKRNAISQSPNHETYIQLLQAGWTSMALERYAYHRFGESIPASTIRTYKQRHNIKTLHAPYNPGATDDLADIMGLRNQVIALQQDRIAIDVAHEKDRGKLFPGTRNEISLLSRLIDSAKADLQDVGIFPKLGEKLEVLQTVEKQSAPRLKSLAEVTGDAKSARDLAEHLHNVLPMPERDAG